MYFSLLPLNIIKNIYIIKFCKSLTNYTSGVYYLHIPIYLYLSNYIKLIKQKNLCSCIILYIICYCISYIGIKIFGKTKLRNLFL